MITLADTEKNAPLLKVIFKRKKPNENRHFILCKNSSDNYVGLFGVNKLRYSRTDKIRQIYFRKTKFKQIHKFNFLINFIVYLFVMLCNNE